jgi:hypothetical protein
MVVPEVPRHARSDMDAGTGVGLRRAPSFKVLSSGNTRARTGSLTLGSRSIQTPVLWLGHSLKSHVRLTSRGDPAAALPILVSFAELRGNSAALGRSRKQGLHDAFKHDGPILLDSGINRPLSRRSLGVLWPVRRRYCSGARSPPVACGLAVDKHETVAQIARKSGSHAPALCIIFADAGGSRLYDQANPPMLRAYRGADR